MVRINLVNGYFIEQELLNYTLKQKFEGEKKDGTPKESVRTIGYFGDLKGAIKRFLKLNQLDENDGLSADMKNYVNSIVAANDKACAEIMKLWGNQIPKKPDLEGDGYADGQLVYDTWICPHCEKKYEVDYEEYDFCPNCGQAIDWSEDNE